MKNIPHAFIRPRSIVALTALMICGARAQTVIYADDFSGDTSALNEMAPDVRQGTEVWTAAPTFKADGSIERPDNVAQGSMTLPFTPKNGFVYTLDASFSGVTGNINWLALGYANGQSSDSLSDRFITDDVVGTAWMLIRGDASINPNQTHLGTGILGAGNGGIGGAPWTVLGDQSGGEIDLRIVLDTSGGAGTWTATWFAKLPASESYAEVRESTLVSNEENYTSVGVAVANTQAEMGTGGTVEAFTLTSSGGPTAVPGIINIETDLDGNIILTLDGSAEGLTAQSSGDLGDFTDLAATVEANTLRIAVGDLDSDGDGSDFFRVRN